MDRRDRATKYKTVVTLSIFCYVVLLECCIFCSMHLLLLPQIFTIVDLFSCSHWLFSPVDTAATFFVSHNSHCSLEPARALNLKSAFISILKERGMNEI